ncbi:MAG TPA: hypothetical protein PKM45_00210 [Giesbergeria sp.]|nr:hypothetical protein [Giesbergeria sp.]
MEKRTEKQARFPHGVTKLLVLGAVMKLSADDGEITLQGLQRELPMLSLGTIKNRVMLLARDGVLRRVDVGVYAVIGVAFARVPKKYRPLSGNYPHQLPQSATPGIGRGGPNWIWLR